MNALTSFDNSVRGQSSAGLDEKCEEETEDTSPTTSLRILLVDDEPTIRQHLKDYLVLMGNTVETAVDGVQGLECFCAATWDVVLVDYAMPHMNGLELAAAIKERSPETRVFLISGVRSLSKDAEFGDLPIDGFIPKPFTVEHLRQALAKAAQNKCDN